MQAFTTGSPWRAPKTDYPDKNVASQQTEPESLWRTYQDVIATRNTQKHCKTGNYRTISSSDNSFLVISNKKMKPQKFVVANLTNGEKN